ncbi:c-type cytochrome [Saccharicrinis sp. FJH62]|uniref:c-type cytochrome n=1 Tax=Saccharicrinis sp. FJH62 TaxID=3344657 RepID=UPI0035D43CAF
MKKFKKILGYGFLVIVIVVIGFVLYLKYALPNIPVQENVNVEITPEQVARGKYLANSVMLCMDCHSQRDWNLFSGPPESGTRGEGGEVFDQEMGFPGKYYTPNITPAALSDWTDGELLRAITSGVNKEGKALFPVMPYLNYAKLDKEDIYSVIAYLRTIEPIEHTVPASKSDFPMSLIIHTIPKEPEFTKRPDKSDLLAYGEYMITAASCTDCHTPMKNGQFIMDMQYAGGMEFPLRTGGKVYSANLTPDKETGIGNWTAESFVARFKVYADSSYSPQEIHHGDFNSEMPWMMYSTMDEYDLKAIFAYLQTLKPKSNKVTKFVPE